MPFTILGFTDMISASGTPRARKASLTCSAEDRVTTLQTRAKSATLAATYQVGTSRSLPTVVNPFAKRDLIAGAMRTSGPGSCACSISFTLTSFRSRSRCTSHEAMRPVTGGSAVRSSKRTSYGTSIYGTSIYGTLSYAHTLIRRGCVCV